MTDRSDPKIRRVRPHRWTALGAAAASGLLATSPMVAAWAAQGGADAGAPIVVAQSSEAGEGGEGGEAGATHENKEAAYLADLGFVSGHLRAGMALYEAGMADLAKTHMKHPGDEIYTELAPEMEERGAKGFADALAALSAKVEGGAPVEEAKAAFDAVIAQIEAARDKAGGGAESRLDATVVMVRTAAEEYAIGVVDGKVAKVHEYQDAWGFIQAAKADLTEVAEGGDAEAAKAAKKMLEKLAETDAAFDGLAPTEAPGDAGVIYGAAARMELAANAVH